MYKQLLIATAFIIAVAQASFAQSQAEGCETEPVDSATFFNWPYFGNNQYLLNLVDSVEGGGNIAARVIPSTLRIPVTAWVYHLNNNTDNITNSVVEQYINAINQFFTMNNSRIRLYLRCGINQVTDSRFYNNVSGANYNAMFNEYYTARTMNIHFTNNTADNLARARFPWKNNPYACYIPTRWTVNGNSIDNVLSNVLNHETGHALGLLHTHDGSRGDKANNAECSNCYQESVSRTRNQEFYCISTIGKKKCEVNADALCDTDADPLLRVNGVTYVLPDCSGYDRTSPYLQDKWDAEWLPAGNNNALNNIMSYSFAWCRSQLTLMQRGVGYFHSLYRLASNGHYVNNFESFYRNEDVDEYENDNFSQNANSISFNSTQIHSFHLVPDANSSFSGCDVDWVRFIPTCDGNFSMETFPVAGKNLANTRITLFDFALNQLAQNDDISGTNFYSKINYAVTQGAGYLIRIENMAPNTMGYYELAIGRIKITDNITGVFCSPVQFGIENLPQGAVVTWSVSPAIGTFNQPNTMPTIFTPTSGGTATITANVVACDINVNLTRVISTGTPSPSLSVDLFCPEVYGVASNAPGATNYIWSIYQNGQLQTYPYGTDSRRFGYVSGNAMICVRYTNACGTSIDACRPVYCDPNSGGRMYSVSPNPTYGSVSVESTSTNTIDEVRVKDKLGNIKLTRKFSKGTKKALFDLSVLPADVYFIEIFDGKKWYTEKMMKN